MNKLYSQFIKSALKRGHSEDDAQEAFWIVISRQGVEFLNKDAPLVMTYLIRALSEARRNNSEAKSRIGQPSKDKFVDVELEYNQPEYVPSKDLSKRLDKLLKRATLSNEQLQMLTLALKGYDNKQIGKVVGFHHNSIGKYMRLIREHLTEVNETVWA